MSVDSCDFVWGVDPVGMRRVDRCDDRCDHPAAEITQNVKPERAS